LPVDPCASDHRTTAAHADTQPLGPHHQRERRGLIVDNNVEAADSFKMLLEAAGFSVRCVYGGVTALSVASAYTPNVIVRDIGRPDIRL
jgi:CheY-like chemotaxis protein